MSKTGSKSGAAFAIGDQLPAWGLDKNMEQPPLDAKAVRPEQVFAVSPLMIFPETMGDFAVYLRQGDGFVLYAGHEERFTGRHKQLLYDNGVQQVYVHMAQKGRFDSYVESHLGRILGDQTIPLDERSRVLVDASGAVLKGVFEERLPISAMDQHFARMENLVRQSLEFLSNGDSLKALAPFISHDYRTYTHCLHVFVYAMTLFQSMDFSEEDKFKYGMGAMLHDIGKTTIPLEILNKRGRLTPEERTVINTHPLQGVAQCTAMPLSQDTLNCILFHHERMDGRGYPSGLASESIPVPVRVISLVDCYDALTSDRPYAKGRKPFEALQLMRNDMLGAFDMDMFTRFISVLSGAEIL